MTAKIRSRYYRGRAAQPVPPPSATVMPLYLVGLRRGLASYYQNVVRSVGLWPEVPDPIEPNS